MGFRTLLQAPFACFNYQTARSDGICLFVVRWWLEFAPEVPDSCQVYPKAIGNLSLPWCAPCCLSYAAVLHVLVKRWRSAEAELDKSRLLGDEVNLFIAPGLKTAVHGYLPLLENFQCSHNEEDWVCKVYVYSKDLYTTRLRCLLTAGEIVRALMEHSFTEQEIALSKGRPSLGRLKSPLS